MGSIGSGRRYKLDEVKKNIEDQISINILDLKKRGCLEPGITSKSTYSKNSGKIGWLLITAAEEELSLDYNFDGHVRLQKIQIASTPVNFGGKRKYLVCHRCESKREMLYYGKDRTFACRKCHGFVFRSQQLVPHMRHGQQAEKLAEKLGGKDFIFYRNKPFRMWDRTFFKLRDRFFMHSTKSCELFMEYFDEVLEKYDSRVGGKKSF